eukprot:jgi/Chlat1/6015/Chrsp4S06200
MAAMHQAAAAAAAAAPLVTRSPALKRTQQQRSAAQRPGNPGSCCQPVRCQGAGQLQEESRGSQLEAAASTSVAPQQSNGFAAFNGASSRSGVTFDAATTTAQPATGSTDSIVEFLRGKNVLIAGGTGFLGKVLIEKILWEQPDVGQCVQIYMLIKPRGRSLSAQQRVDEQVLPAPVFNRLRQAYGAGYEDFMSSRITAISGDIGSDHLGLDASVAEMLKNTVDVVVNSAATTTFDERYDTAVRINTLGAERIISFAKQCRQLQLVVHVSTAFVNGTRQGKVMEKPFQLGDSIAREHMGDAAPQLDVRAEVALAVDTATKAREVAEQRGLNENDTNTFVQEQLVSLGMERALAHGWQDTYVFTKAMGEMLVSSQRGDIPVAIIRPSIVESAMAEPTQGWIEGIRMADPIIIAYGKGQMRGFLGDKNGVLDVVPVDVVINAMLAAMVRHAKTTDLEVYHVATSVANPLTNPNFTSCVSRHFASQPFVDKQGQPIKLQEMIIFPNQQTFAADTWLRYQLPLQLARLFPFTVREGSARRRLTILQKTFEQLSYFAKIYQPYTFYSCRFDSSNTLRLFSELSAEEQERFNFDLTGIDWYHYLALVHLPGLKKYVLKGRGSS